MLYTTNCKTPVGTLQLVASNKGLVAVLWPQYHGKKLPFEGKTLTTSNDHPVLQSAAAQLEEYFAGQRQKFDVPLDLQGTEFQVLFLIQSFCLQDHAAQFLLLSLCPCCFETVDYQVSVVSPTKRKAKMYCFASAPQSPSRVGRRPWVCVNFAL